VSIHTGNQRRIVGLFRFFTQPQDQHQDPLTLRTSASRCPGEFRDVFWAWQVATGFDTFKSGAVDGGRYGP